MMAVLRSFAAMASLTIALLTLQLAGCGKSESQPPEGGGASPPQQVTVLELQPQDLPVQFEYVGRLEASREIEIRPRITGLIEQRLFEEGGRVDAGQSLFRIDAAPFTARRQATEAALAEARTRLVQAERDVQRLAPLAKKQTVSQSELDDAVSNRDLNRAAVAAAEAELTQATLELGYTNVIAPISGHIGRALQVEGALVSPTSGALARLAQIDPMYVNFSIPENEQLTIDRQRADGSLVLSPPDQTRVEVRLADGTPYPLAGRVDFNDYRTDPQTGAFSVRATLPNPDAKLSPGQFVRVRIEGATLPGALAVPQRAVQEDASGKFVYVVGQGENGMTVAQPKPVEVGQWVEKTGAEGIERLWVIRSGLTPGDRVVTDGTARIFFPGMPVMPQPAGTTPSAQDPATQAIDNEAP